MQTDPLIDQLRAAVAAQAKATPGPWVLGKDTSDDFAIVCSKTTGDTLLCEPLRVRSYESCDLVDGIGNKADLELAVVARNLDLAALLARLERAEAALRAVAAVHNDPCQPDHHGICQAHSLRVVLRGSEWVPECEMKLVREALSLTPTDPKP